MQEVSKQSISVDKIDGPSSTYLQSDPYIILQFPNRIYGQLTEMVSKEQLLWRTIETHEQYPYKQMAKYFRNVTYT